MTQDSRNALLKLLKGCFDDESYAKFQQILDYLGEPARDKLFTYYHENLREDLSHEIKVLFPEDFDLNRYIRMKSKLYSFKLIGQLGTILIKLEQIGKPRAEETLVKVFKLLIHHGLVARGDSANFALVELQQLCKNYNVTLPMLYQRYRRKLLRVVVKAILKKLDDRVGSGNGLVNGHTNGNGNVNANGNGSSSSGTGSGSRESAQFGKTNRVVTYMTRAFEVFNVSTITTQDIAQSLVIISYLLWKDKYTKLIELFLQQLANCQNNDVARLLGTHIETIMASLLLEGKMSSFDMQDLLKKLCVIAGRSNPRELLETKFTSIKGRLLLHYSIDEKKVKDALFYLSTCELDEMDQPFPDDFDDEKTFIEHLNPSMIGILLGVDSHFNATARNFGSPESIANIRSLTMIISKLDSKQVATIHPKLLSTLCLLLRLRSKRDNNDLNIALVGLWDVFIHKLDRDVKNALLINVCVALHDLIEDCPAEVAKLYSYLILGKHTREEEAKYKCLFFIPETPGFEKIYLYLNAYVRRGNKKRTIKELELAIDCALPLIRYENQKCHILAVNRIKELLKFNQDLLISDMLTNPDEPLNDLISKTIESLLSVLSTQECSEMIAECLGIIGAVNPVRLSHLIYGNIGAGESVYMDIKSKAFTISLIEKLKNSLLSDRRSESETASYALQVVMKTTRNVTEITKELSEQARKACELCKNTKYETTPRIPPDMSMPLYTRFKNDGQYSYKDWLDKFFLVLIPMVDNAAMRTTLHACTFNFRHNIKFAEYLFPIVLINIIVTRTVKVEIIQNEIMAIINDSVGVSSQDYDTVLSNDYEHSLQTLHFQCANFVFLLMDSLSRFEQSIMVDKTDHRTRLDSLQVILKSTPKDKLAVLALKCRAYARALYYFDQYYFETKNWGKTDIGITNAFDKYWTSLQKVLLALDDSYEAAGVQMRRTSPITAADEIANLESAGKYDKAVLHYDSLLESKDERIDRKQLIEDALKCLSNQGNDRRLYERSRYLMEQYPAFKRSILPAAVEAFWKLGKWDELDYTLKNDTCNSMLDSTAVCQGVLLNTLINPDKTDITNQLKIVRDRSIRPLSIAMIDRSAYFRGYRNLLVLHRIEDYNQAVDILSTKQFETQALDENTVDGARNDLSERLKTLLITWGKRNKLVEPALRSIEPLLSWQRSISEVLIRKYPFVQSQLCLDIGSMWLASADTAREARCFDRSFYCVTQAKHWFGQDILRDNLLLQVRCTIAQAKLNWEQCESTEALKCLTSSIQQLHNHKLHQHLETRKTKITDIRRKTSSNPYFHPDDEPYPDISAEPCEECAAHDINERESFARLKILLTSYTEEAAACTPRALLNMYEECVHLGVDKEEVYLLLARYYDKLANYYTENPDVLKLTDKALLDDRPEPGSLSNRIVKTTKGRPKTASQDKKDKELAHREDIISKLMEQSILAFGESLKNGVRYLEESMPRMLNIWFDLGSKKSLQTMAYYPRAINSRIESTLRMFETVLLRKDSKDSLPSYYFMPALSLLLSRVCHPNPGICEKTSLILEQILIDYPHQLLWRMQAMLNDKDERNKAADRIIKNACKKNSALTHVVLNYRKFVNCVKDITLNYTQFRPMTTGPRQKAKELKHGPCSISDIVRDCGNLEVQGEIIPPIQSSMNPILPTENDFANLKKHQIYPEHYMSFIKRIKSECFVYNSLQKPRCITLICSTGKEVQILCKAGDDLRKDSRAIEFFNLLNRILRRSSQSNVRFFEIATYNVLPLEDRAGLLEMIPNCVTLRKITESLYREVKGPSWGVHDLLHRVDRYDQCKDAELYQKFVEKILPQVKPPVFQKFFARKFSEPTRWYLVKLAYARTLALSSMVGYIIGLGDRHLDNILIEQDMGRVVHVDYNLLFHQAESLQVPELVPFRLTHNMIAPLGPMGIEGNFRKYSEIAIRVMRNEKELLLTTLKPFLHDPCCEWTRSGDNRAMNQDGNSNARDRIQVCERKLKGFPRVGVNSKPLTVLKAFSVEAQVDTLIDEATDLYSLSKMYYGWCPHI